MLGIILGFMFGSMLGSFETASPADRCSVVSAYVAERCGQSSAKLSDYVFSQPLWKAFGEHLGEEQDCRKAEPEEPPNS